MLRCETRPYTWAILCLILFSVAVTRTGAAEPANDDSFSAEKSISHELVADGQERTYTLDVGSTAGYRGIITQLRFDPIENSQPGDRIDLYSLVIR